MMAEKAKKGEPVRRCLLIYEVLVRHVVYGMSNKEIAEATRSTAVNVSRDLDLLEGLGWVKKLDNGRFTLTTKPLALLKAFELEYNEMLGRAEEVRTNITAAAQRHRG